MAVFFGTQNQDTLTGIVGNDIIFGLQGDDSLLGFAGNNVIFGDEGNDIILGNIGNDVLIGGSGSDFLFGSDGNDTLYGNEESNTLVGGAGEDLFVLELTLGSEPDFITDFEFGRDKIGLPPGVNFENLTFTVLPNPTTVRILETGISEVVESGEILVQLIPDNQRPRTLARLQYIGETPSLSDPNNFITNLSPITSVIQFSSPSFILGENGSPSNAITLNRNGDTSTEATVNLNLNNGIGTPLTDFSLSTISVNFAPNETTKIVTIPIINDNLFEAQKAFNLTLSNPSTGTTIGGQSTSILLLNDDDTSLEFSNSSFTVNENGNSVSAVTVTRTGNLFQTVSTTLTLSNGTGTASQDYNNNPIELIFTPGVSVQTVNIPIANDTLVEGSETINLALENPSEQVNIGSNGTAILNILDDDVSFQFSSPTYSINEDGTPLSPVNIIRRGDLTKQVSATLTLTNGTASSPEDYINTPIEVIFAPNETSKIVNIPIVNDLQNESSETVNLTLGNPSAGERVSANNIAVLEIIDNDPLPTPVPPTTPTPPSSSTLTPGTIEFSQGSFLINDNGVSIAAVTLTRTGGSDGIVSATISLSDGTATAGQDYNNTPITVTFADGELAKTINIPIIDDTLVEVSETINLGLNNPTGGAIIGNQNTATLTIARSDMPALLDFENAGNLNAVQNLYASQGISFSENALSIMSSKALDELGRQDEFGGNFGTPPSGTTALTYGESDQIIMNVAGGFDSLLSFFYASPYRTHSVNIYDGLGATGNLLGSISLPQTQAGFLPDAYSIFNQITLPFSGIARSVSFGDFANKLVLDNILLGS
ncbi:hypothetical protein NG798_07485 [Ancylothrix sp. C2]|uniref:Calx-beta domain-containing protein n=1 Tax=Ancylothrix sp. D3o TaxID=2953691 RepID=UPI0021BB9DB3|nr:Calx-beta domain-containing protein [Ancylothrix sp. D3o]MCT7949625.1 hypothetical protein [Ancylothrix sp. D3o]